MISSPLVPLSKHDGTHGGPAYAELGGNSDLWHSSRRQMPNGLNIFLGQLRAGVSMTHRTSSFSYLVSNIVACPPQKQVVRTNAGRIVAVMTNPHVVRDGSEVQFPRDSMSTIVFAVAPTSTNPAVSVLTEESRPQPTPIGFVDLRPKPIFQWCAIRSVLVPRNVRLREALDVPSRGRCGGSDWSGLATTTLAQSRRIRILGFRKEFWSRLRVHLADLLSGRWGVMPTDASNIASAFACLNYTAIPGKKGDRGIYESS